MEFIMQKIGLLLLIAFISISAAHAQNNWIVYKIDKRLSAKLPVTPKSIDSNSVISVTPDSSAFVITIVDFAKVANLDSAALISMASTEDFANQLKTGMLSQMQGFTLGDVKIGKWMGYTCFNMEGGNADKKVKLYTFMVIIGSNLYGMSAAFPEKNNPASKDVFFSSLQLNKH